ncbi:hypothetical protein BDZ97DRAFT_1761241 [Flammula alnicola]|nr:hypothetical protein BDZ97DRAFT_1761241 [Flammula alnicola]
MSNTLGSQIQPTDGLNASSDQFKTVLLNLAYPSRSSAHVPWARSSDPLKTVSERYETSFVYSNGSAGLVGNAVNGGVRGAFEHEVLRWLKKFFSHHTLIFRRKLKLFKAKLSAAHLLRRTRRNP